MNYLLIEDKIILVIKMARKPGIHYPGALYHVMARGNNGENVLNEEINKNKYLDILVLYKEKIGFMLYAYCIMDNEDMNKAIKLYIRFMNQGEKEIIYTDTNEFQSTNSAVKNKSSKDIRYT